MTYGGHYPKPPMQKNQYFFREDLTDRPFFSFSLQNTTGGGKIYCVRWSENVFFVGVFFVVVFLIIFHLFAASAVLLQTTAAALWCALVPGERLETGVMEDSRY